MLPIEIIINNCVSYDYNILFFQKLFVTKDWSIDDLLKLELPFFLHTGEYIQFHDVIQYLNANFSMEERNAKIHDYLALQHERFLDRLTLKKPDIFNYNAFSAFWKANYGTPWSQREAFFFQSLIEIYPNYKLELDFADIEINGSAKVIAYPNFIK